MALMSLLTLFALTGCGLLPDAPISKKSARELAHPGLPKMGAGDIPEGSPRLPAELANGPKRDELPEGTPGTVVFIVLDTVRADHLSACGYERPTSPNLELLVERGASLTCDAYAPATWTLPSHATYFTGLDVADHGMLRKGVVLADEVETLAETFASRGYQTLMISANPVLKRATGLDQGFHRAQVAPNIVSPLRAGGVAKLLRAELAQIDPTRPLFLFLNVMDAHDPYAPVSKGLDWIEPQDAVYFKQGDPSAPLHAYLAGALPEPERGAFETTARNGYDHAVFMADDGMGRIIRVLERYGLGKEGVRVVVTSDHGENLGDHGLMLHDGPPWESTARVPLLYFDSLRTEPLELPHPVSASVAYHLVKDGKLPDPLPPVRSSSVDYLSDADPRYHDAVALWPGGSRKLMWREDATVAYDLAQDPGEATALPLTADEQAQLDAAVKAHQETKAALLGMSLDDRVMKLLEKVGYVAR